MALCWRRCWLSAGNPQPRFPPRRPLRVGLSASPRHGGRVPRRNVLTGPHRSVSPLRAPSGQSDGSTSAVGAGPLRRKRRRAQTPTCGGWGISSQPSRKMPPATACQRVCKPERDIWGHYRSLPSSPVTWCGLSWRSRSLWTGKSRSVFGKLWGEVAPSGVEPALPNHEWVQCANQPRAGPADPPKGIPQTLQSVGC